MVVCSSLSRKIYLLTWWIRLQNVSLIVSVTLCAVPQNMHFKFKVLFSGGSLFLARSSFVPVRLKARKVMLTVDTAVRSNIGQLSYDVHTQRYLISKLDSSLCIRDHPLIDVALFSAVFLPPWPSTVVFWGSMIGLKIFAQNQIFIIGKHEK